MTRVRGFEVATKYRNSGIQLPKRSTKASAGYDIRANETVTIPSFVRSSHQVARMLVIYENQIDNKLVDEGHVDHKRIAKGLDYRDKKFMKLLDERLNHDAKPLSSITKPVLVHTGIKAYFPDNEMLAVYNRSSNPVKRGLYLSNGVGVIDADYYDNQSNEGELMGEFINLSPVDYTIHKGDRIMQGVFQPYLLADGDNATGKRKGGVGSTGK